MNSDEVCKKYNIRSDVHNGNNIFCAKDIGTGLGLRNVRESIKHVDPEHKILCGILDAHGREQLMTFLTFEGVQRLISSSRKPVAQEMATAFGINVINTHYVKVEPAIITFLAKAFEGEKWIAQYHVGPYMVDMYFPRANVAIEVDEEGTHGNDRKIQDSERQEFVQRFTGCQFIRTRPQRSDFCMASLINEVWKALK